MSLKKAKFGPMVTALIVAVALLVVTTTQSVSAAGVSTDKDDYENGETVVITGSGFSGGAALTVRVTWPPQDGRVDSAAVAADSTGGFIHNYVLGLDAISGVYTVDVLDSGNNVLASTTFFDTHFRYGHITSIAGSGNTVDFIVTNAWRQNAYRTGNSRCRDWTTAGTPAIACTGPGTGSVQAAGIGDVIWERQGNTKFEPGDGSVISTTIRSRSALLYLVTSTDVANNWLFGVALDPNKLPTAIAANAAVITHTYASAGPRTAQIQDCCRILTNSAPNGHINNGGQGYRVIDRVDVGSGDSSGVSALPPIVACPINALCTFFVPGADTDGDQLNFRFSTSAEATNTSGFDQPGPPDSTFAATLNSASGLYSWDTTGATLSAQPNTLYSTQVTIESLDGFGNVIGTVAVDWLITLVPVVNNTPVFDVPPTPDAAGPGCSQTHSVNVGGNISYTVQASDIDPGDNVTLNAVGTPPGATHVPGLPTVGNPASTAFSWTPTAIQVGAHIIIYSATDNAGQQALCSQTINVTPASTDTTPPSCEINIVGDELHVDVQDTGSGIQAIDVLVSDNANVAVPVFTAGTKDLLTVIGTKVDGSSPSRVELRITDAADNVTECDPVLAELDRGPSSPRYSTYDAIPQVERYFTISNTGESIITYALVNVNDRWFIIPALLPYEIKTIDIGSAMVSGAKNTVTVWGGGHGSQIMISDVIPTRTNMFAYPDGPLY